MIRLFKVVLSLILCICITHFSIPDVAHCEDQVNEGKAIKAIVVKNNRAISSETVLSKIKTKVGDEFSQVVLNEDLKRLYATEYFTDVSIDVENYEDGLKVT